MTTLAWVAAYLAFAGLAVLVAGAAMTILNDNGYWRFANTGLIIQVGGCTLAVVDLYSTMRLGGHRWELNVISDLGVYVALVVAIVLWWGVLPYRPITSRH